LTKISLRQYGFSLIELAIGLAISSIVAAAATSVFSPLLRTIKQTDDIATLNSGTAHVDDYLRTLTRNLGGGALHPGDLITVLNGADATGTVRADRLIIARALGSGVYASAASGSGASLTLSFSADCRSRRTTMPAHVSADGVGTAELRRGHHLFWYRHPGVGALARPGRHLSRNERPYH
jgi:prepilin-type N-terminal cleavage/methylation domain-containing protein